MLYPVKNYRISNPFGSKFTGASRQKSHQGIDFVSSNLNIFSAHSGFVRSVGFERAGAGNYITVWTEDKRFYTCYFHLAFLPKLSKNDYVHVGDIIGMMGSTGNSTGVHLHFEIRKPKLFGYDFLDPALFLNTPNEYIPTIPTPQSIPFKVQVQKGDGLSNIAKNGGLSPAGSVSTWQEIYRLNQGYRGSTDWVTMNTRLKVGDWITVKL